MVTGARKLKCQQSLWAADTHVYSACGIWRRASACKFDALPAFHNRAGIFDEEQARLYTAEIVAAIAHLHSLHIVHRDLKPVRL
jgi:hypothetical protein